MELTIHISRDKNGLKYTELSHERTTISLGWLLEDEQRELASTFRAAADTLDPQGESR